jgi:PAS domain-containing protein
MMKNESSRRKTTKSGFKTRTGRKAATVKAARSPHRAGKSKAAEGTTDRSRAGEITPNLEEKCRLMVQNAGEGILVIHDGILIYVNPKLSRITGYSEQELTSKRFAPTTGR